MWIRFVLFGLFSLETWRRANLGSRVQVIGLMDEAQIPNREPFIPRVQDRRAKTLHLTHRYLDFSTHAGATVLAWGGCPSSTTANAPKEGFVA